MRLFDRFVTVSMILGSVMVYDPVALASDQCQDKLPLGRCWTTEDVISERIDHHAQSAMFRMFAVGGDQAADASAILCAIKRAQLEGVYLPDQKVPALRAQDAGGWWTIIPPGQPSECYKHPANRPPLIAFRKQIKDNRDFVANAISTAWRRCGISPSNPRCYVATIARPPEPPPEKVEPNQDQATELIVTLVRGGTIYDAKALAAVYVASGGQVRYTAVAKAAAFKFTLDPGTYRTFASEDWSGCKFSAPQDVVIPPGQTAFVTLELPLCADK